MALQHQPRESCEIPPALPIAHSLDKPCRSQQNLTAIMEEKIKHMGLTPASNAGTQCCHTRLPSVPGNSQHCAPAPPDSGQCVRLHNLCTEFQLMFTERLSKVYCCTARKHMTDKTITRRPGFPKILVLSWKLAEQFSPALKQEVAPSPQQTAESLWALRCCLNTQGFLCFTVFMFYLSYFSI